MENNKERQSNIELLRILLMLTIPVYHLMLYNGVFYIDYNPNTIPGILLSAAGAIPADYAFVALSAYFLCKEDEERNGYLFFHIPYYKKSIQRFLEFGTLCLSIYVIKVAVLRSLFGFHNQEYFVDFFLMKGAWWYVYPYLLLLLLYPFLNLFFQKMDIKRHRSYMVVAFLLFMGINYCNKQNVVFDFLGFFLVYVIVSYLQKVESSSNRKWSFLIVAVLCAVVLIGVCVFLKLPNGVVDNHLSDFVVKRLIGRYSVIACVMGISVFYFFKQLRIPYHPFVNWLAKSVVFVFLLHDTWMGVFWYLGKCDNQLAYYPTSEFLLWTAIYTFSAFVVAIAVGECYRRGIKPLWNKLIQKII